MSNDWKIYGIFENCTGKCIYIGRTSMSLENRWFYHIWKNNKKQSPIWKYIQEKGAENFTIELLMVCKSREEWCEWEAHLLLELSPLYNCRIPTQFT